MRKSKRDINRSTFTEYRVMRRAKNPKYYVEYREPGEQNWEEEGEVGCYSPIRYTTYYYTLEEAKAAIKRISKEDVLENTPAEVVWTYRADEEPEK